MVMYSSARSRMWALRRFSSREGSGGRASTRLRNVLQHQRWNPVREEWVGWAPRFRRTARAPGPGRPGVATAALAAGRLGVAGTGSDHLRGGQPRIHAHHDLGRVPVVLGDDPPELAVVGDLVAHQVLDHLDAALELGVHLLGREVP